MGFFQDLFSGFGGKQKKIDQNQGTPVPSNLRVSPLLAQSEDILGERLKQGAAGFNFNDLSNALAAQQRASLQQDIIPGMQEAAAGRGLVRGTAAVRDEGRATQQTERDIAQQRAELGIQSRKFGEDVFGRNIDDAIGLGARDLAQRNAFAEDEQARSLQNIKFDQARAAADKEGAMRGAALGATVAAPFIGAGLGALGSAIMPAATAGAGAGSALGTVGAGFGGATGAGGVGMGGSFMGGGVGSAMSGGANALSSIAPAASPFSSFQSAIGQGLQGVGKGISSMNTASDFLKSSLGGKSASEKSNLMKLIMEELGVS